MHIQNTSPDSVTQDRPPLQLLLYEEICRRPESRETQGEPELYGAGASVPETDGSTCSQNQLHLLGAAPINSHTVFVDDEEEVKNFDEAAHFDTVPELVGRAFNRPRRGKLEAAETPAVSGPRNMAQVRKASRQRDQAYTELSKRLGRGQKMKSLLERKQNEKNIMGKGKKRKVADAKDGSGAVFKWKRQRAR